MGIVWVDTSQIGTFTPDTVGTSGTVFLNSTNIGMFGPLLETGDVFLNGTKIGVYTAIPVIIPPLGHDPKTVLVTQLKPNITVFKDDEVTPATVYVVFNIPPETIRELLKTQYDAVVTIGDPERDDVIRRATVDFHEASLYPVRGYCIDKTGITAKTLMWRLVREIWRVINASASSPGGQVRHWNIGEGQTAEDITTFKQLLLCRRVGVKLFFVETA